MHLFYQLSYFLQMTKEQWEPLDELKKRQEKKLKRLIKDAYFRVPYYRELFDSMGLKPEDIKKIEDLKNVPFMTKKILQSEPLKKIVAKDMNHSRLIKITTSGSTGTPLKLYYTRKDFTRLNMGWLRPLLAHGVKPWHKKMEISGPHNIPEKSKWYNLLGFFRKNVISIFNEPSEWFAAWQSSKFDVLYGYSGSLKILANHIIANNLKPIKPQYIFGVSDLVDEECRELIQKAFKTKLIDLYGAAEAGCIAWQCPLCNGYHLNSDTVLVEFLQGENSSPPGSRGRIVVTNLYSTAMPLIRYELEDVGIPSPENSSCGRGLPLMKIIEGRCDAFLTLPSGKTLSPMFFFSLMKNITGIKQWRVVQKIPSQIDVYIIPLRSFASHSAQDIKNEIEKKIEDKIQIKVILTESIPPDLSGKLRAVISYVKNPALIPK